MVLNISSWWFGTFFSPYIGNFIIPIDYIVIFQRGGSTTNQIWYFMIITVLHYINLYQISWNTISDIFGTYQIATQIWDTYYRYPRSSSLAVLFLLLWWLPLCGRVWRWSILFRRPALQSLGMVGVVSSLENPRWEKSIDGKIMGKSREQLKKTWEHWEHLGNSLENHGNIWENHGTIWENHGKIMGKSWEHDL